MSAAPTPDAVDGIREQLDELYPGQWTLSLIALGPRSKIPQALDWPRAAAERVTRGEGREQHLARAARHVAAGGNVGLAVPAGVIVLDADDGASVAWLDAALPDASMQRTAKGAHFVCRLPAGASVRAAVGVELAEGVRADLRVGGASQIVVAPSIHPSGHEYHWKRELPPAIEDLPELPAGLLARIVPPQRPVASVGTADGDAIPAGRRNATLARFAGALRRDGLCADEIAASLVEINARRCDPPLAASEVLSIARGMQRYEPGNPVREAEAEAPAPGERRAVLTTLSSVEPEHVEWLWQGRIPRGAVSSFEGDPGLGKTTIALDLASRVSTGAAMPDGTPGVLGDVLVVSYEDNLSQTIRPHLDAAGADVARVHAFAIATEHGIEDPSLPRDLSALEGAIQSKGAALVIFDPLVAALGGEVDSHRDQDVRRVLAPLKRVAESTGAAVLVIRHLRKQHGGNPLHAAGGSIGITAALRSTMLVAPDPEDPENCAVLARSKCNLSAPVPALGFRRSSKGSSFVIEWLGPVDYTAAGLLAASGVDGEERSAKAEARAWLAEELAGGARPAKEIQREARAAGISDRTLDRARQSLRVRAEKGGLRGGWFWTLPDPSPKGANGEELGALREVGALRGDHSGFSAAESASGPKGAKVSVLAPFGDEAAAPDAPEREL